MERGTRNLHGFKSKRKNLEPGVRSCRTRSEDLGPGSHNLQGLSAGYKHLEPGAYIFFCVFTLGGEDLEPGARNLDGFKTKIETFGVWGTQFTKL